MADETLYEVTTDSLGVALLGRGTLLRPGDRQAQDFDWEWLERQGAVRKLEGDELRAGKLRYAELHPAAGPAEVEPESAHGRQVRMTTGDMTGEKAVADADKSGDKDGGKAEGRGARGGRSE